MNKSIILSILGVAVVAGLAVLALQSNNKVIEETSGNVPVPMPDILLENSKIGDNPKNNFSEFGKTITLRLKEKIIFPDGLVVTLREINDSRCKPDVQCIWAGEISGAFKVSGGNISVSKEIHLGTTTNKSITSNGYTFSLKVATETRMTIEVVKN